MAMLQVRIDDELKNEESALYDNLGMDLSTAIRMFLKRSVMIGGIPFDVTYDDGSIGFLVAMKKMQEHSIKIGNDKMTLDEINEEIKKAREEKKNKEWFAML